MVRSKGVWATSDDGHDFPAFESSMNGPFLLSLGWVDNDSFQLQFALGRPVPEGSMLDDVR